MPEKKKKHRLWVIWLILIVGIIASIVWFLTHKTEEYISEGARDAKISSLECVASRPIEPFFMAGKAQSLEHSLKLIFKDGIISDLSYVLEGTYNSAGAAETAAAEMHAQYNKYMRTSAESFNPVFSAAGTRAKISLYVDGGKFTQAIAKVLFIDGGEYQEINDYGMEDFGRIFKERGFDCLSHD